MSHTRCIPSIQGKKIINNVIHTTFELGASLENVYPLLQIIFEKLMYEDLKSAALVNTIWKKYACEEMKRRNKASWITLMYSKSRHTDQSSSSIYKIEKSDNFKYDDVVFGLIFYKYRNIKLNEYICIHEDPVMRITFSEYLSNQILSPNTDFWAFSCSEIYSPKTITAYNQHSFVGLFIPQIRNIKIKKFYIPKRYNETIGNHFSENEHVHCILLFTVSSLKKIVKEFTIDMLERQNQNSFALAGGIISSGIKPFQNRKEDRVFNSKTLFCIAFTQDRDKDAMFDSYSVIIKKNFEERLLEFKSSIKLRENSFAIRICCAAKEEKEKETAIFNKIFPKTFVVGLDADGEIGWDKFDPWQPEQDVPETKKNKKQLTTSHEYTSIIVIMTWGTLIEK